MHREEIGLEDTQKFLPNDSSDPSTVKFSGDDRKITFNGLSKEEIMKYGNDPQWVKIRWALFILFWIVWLAMLAAAILIVIFSPKCAFRPKQSWWQKEVFYQLDVSTFKDSNNDGIGDIQGLAKKLDYFDDLNIKTICLRDNFYDPNDPKKVVVKFGDDASLKELRKALDAKDIHLVIDLKLSDLKENAESIIEYWLNFADGVRIVGIDKNTNASQFSEFEKWVKLAQQIYEKTFKPKFISFYNYEESKPEQSLKVSSSFLKTTKEDLKDQNSFGLKINGLVSSSAYILNYYDVDRIQTSFKDTKLLPLYHGLVLLLRGTPILYYGDELGFTEDDQLMKWDNSNGCGFSGNSSITDDKCESSVKELTAHGSGETLLTLIKKIIKFRQEPSISWGNLIFADQSTKDNILSYVRKADDFPGYIIAANLDKKPYLVDFTNKYKTVTEKATVEYFYTADHSNYNDFKIGAEVKTDSIKIKPGVYLILKF